MHPAGLIKLSSSTRTKCSHESCHGERGNALLWLSLQESQLISEFSRLQEPEALCQLQRKAVKRGEFKPPRVELLQRKGQGGQCSHRAVSDIYGGKFLVDVLERRFHGLFQ